jgi:hypothetical protein
LSLSNEGIVAGAQVSLSSLGLPGTGTGDVYVASSAMSDFDPGTFGFSGQPFSLPQGLDVGFQGDLPGSVTSALQKIIPTFPASASAQAMASLSASGFTMSLTLLLGTTTGGIQVLSSNGGAFYLDDLGLSFAVTTSADIGVTVSGTGYIELPALDPGSPSQAITSPSQATATFSGSLTVSAEPSLTLSLGFSNWGSSGVLGVQGLSAQSFGGSFGLTLDGEIPTPTLGFYASQVQLPGLWESTIGMVPGSQVSFNVNLSVSQPVFSFSISGPPAQPGQAQQPALTPLAIDPNLSSAVIDSVTVSQAGFDFAPEGGTDPGTGETITAGASLVFGTSIDSVEVNFGASVDLSSPSVSAYASVSSFSIPTTAGSAVQVTSPGFFLALNPSDPLFGIAGGISYDSDSFSTTIELQVGSTLNDASIWLSATAGLPSYFAAGVFLNGVISASSSGASITASGSGSFAAGGATLGPVSFYLSIPGGLSWSDVSNSITQVAQFFVNAGTSATEIVQILQSLGYDTYDIINALGDVGDYSSTWISDLASAFGFSTTYYDIWTYTSAAEDLVLDVSGGSQSPSASVITWDWNNGYNQDWAFVQSPYSGWYDIVNRGSGQCLTVQYNTAAEGNPLIQYPCNGGWNQLWYMGSISLATTYVIESALDGEVADVSGAYPWPGGSLDQWPSNGGSNQQFWLTNSGN